MKKIRCKNCSNKFTYKELFKWIYLRGSHKSFICTNCKKKNYISKKSMWLFWGIFYLHNILVIGLLLTVFRSNFIELSVIFRIIFLLMYMIIWIIIQIPLASIYFEFYLED
jgi:CXXC-20-CXXC protein